MSNINEFFILAGEFVAQCMFVAIMTGVGVSLIAFAGAICVWAYKAIRRNW